MNKIINCEGKKTASAAERLEIISSVKEFRLDPNPS